MTGLGTLALVWRMAPGCATQPGSGTGEGRTAQEERVNDPAI
ncbi:MAG: hypothetical protein ACT4O4_08470 [Nitrospiraceae bacterium]